MRQAARLAAWEDESGTTAFVEYAVVDVLSFKGGSSPGGPFVTTSGGSSAKRERPRPRHPV